MEASTAHGRARPLCLLLCVALLLPLFLGGCGGKDASRGPRDGGGDTRPPPDAEAVPRVQVVYYATDRARVDLDAGWHADRFLFPGLVAVIGGLLILGLFRIVARRYRWVVGILTVLYGVATFYVVVGTLWDVGLKHDLAERVDGIVYGHGRGSYGGDGGLPLELGRMEVSVPPAHTEGELERPELWKGEFREDPRKHWLIATVDVMGEDVFFRELRQDAADDDAMLVFVHGYNTSFEEGAHRAAQIAWDLDFRGPAIYYSWPSAGQLEDYPRDGESVKWTRRHLQAFLRALAEQVPGRKIHLIAHSMGNRALTEALVRIRLDRLQAREAARAAGEAPGPMPADPFRQIVLAAPDIDASTFREDIVPAIRGEDRRITLYASRNDWALRESQRFNGAPRAGQADPEHLVVVEGIETVDVSEVTDDHSYIGSNSFVLGSLRAILAGAPRPIEDRSREDLALREVPVESPDGRIWWVLRPVDGD